MQNRKSLYHALLDEETVAMDNSDIRIGSNKIIIPNGSVATWAMASTTTLAFSTTIASITTGSARSPAFWNERFFLPDNAASGRVIAVRASDNSTAATLTGLTNPTGIAVGADKILLCERGATRARFVSYSTTTEAFALGTSITGIGALTATFGNGMFFVLDETANSVVVISAASESSVQTLTNATLGVGTIRGVAFGGGLLLVSGDSGVRLLDANNAYSSVHFNASITSAYLPSYANNHFCLPRQSANTCVLMSRHDFSITATITNLQFPTGSITDGTTFYVANQSGTTVAAIPASSTGTIDGSTAAIPKITGLNAPRFIS